MTQGSKKKKKAASAATVTARTAARTMTLTNKPGTAAAFIEVAKGELGTIEGPKNNETKYGKEFGMNFLPWCGSFVNWCAKKAGVKIPNTISTIAGSNAFKKNKAWYPAAKATPQPGDLVYFDFPNDGVNEISHVGLVIAVKGNNVVTIEGNTSPTSKGSQRNGGMVAQKVRAYKGKNVPIVGFGRPKFKA